MAFPAIEVKLAWAPRLNQHMQDLDFNKVSYNLTEPAPRPVQSLNFNVCLYVCLFFYLPPPPNFKPCWLETSGQSAYKKIYKCNNKIKSWGNVFWLLEFFWVFGCYGLSLCFLPSAAFLWGSWSDDDDDPLPPHLSPPPSPPHICSLRPKAGSQCSCVCVRVCPKRLIVDYNQTIIMFFFHHKIDFVKVEKRF